MLSGSDVNRTGNEELEFESTCKSCTSVRNCFIGKEERERGERGRGSTLKATQLVDSKAIKKRLKGIFIHLLSFTTRY
jgi:hypothetical protein